MQKVNYLQKKIMRRVYMAFAKRVALHPITVKLGLFVLALAVFADMVHVKRIVENVLSTPVGDVPQLVLNAVMRGEVVTLMAMGVIAFVLVSLPFNVRSLFPRVQSVPAM